MKGILTAIGVFLLLGAIAGGVWWVVREGTTEEAAGPATRPATRPAVEDSPPTTQPRMVASFLDLVREVQPAHPATQPLAYVVKFAESARITLERPLFIDSRRDVWVTHPDAPPLIETLKAAPKEQVHIVPERVRYVRWLPAENGIWRPHLLVDGKGDGRAYQLIRPTGQREGLPDRPFLWARAIDWGETTVIPTPTGVSVLHFDSPVREQYYEWPGLDASAAAPPALVADLRGVLAFRPADGERPGADHTARYVDAQWVRLPHGDCDQILQLVPLLDGSLLRILRDGPGNVRLDLLTLEAVEVDRPAILELLERLSDVEQDERARAFAELQKYGQGIWPILEQVAEEQPPEARIRIRQLLKNRIAPTLAGMQVIDNRLQVVERQPDGTVLFYAPHGVRIDNERDQSTLVPKAWIAAGPWTGIQLLNERMTWELQPGREIVRFVGGEWIVSDAAHGPRQWVGNSFVELLGRPYRSFKYVLGTDRASRWYFVGDDPAGPRGLDQPVLVIDRRLPDMTPRLPVWTWDEPKAQMGWDDKGFPGMKAGGAFVLDMEGWRNLDLKNEPFHTAATAAGTQRVSVTPTTQSVPDAPLLTTPDGTRYYGGNERLLVVDPDGRETRWTLPPEAMGSAPPWLVRTDDGRLFLFNQPGRLVRIRPTPDAAGPFEIEAVFTRGIPNVRNPKRIWLDPAGRIVILADGHRMAICFPSGRIPRPTSLLMPAGAEEQDW